MIKKRNLKNLKRYEPGFDSIKKGEEESGMSPEFHFSRKLLLQLFFTLFIYRHYNEITAC